LRARYPYVERRGRESTPARFGLGIFMSVVVGVVVVVVVGVGVAGSTR
jgi:hypothetical protein